jgi:hypothetical protein
LPILIGRGGKPFTDFSPSLYPEEVGVTAIECPYTIMRHHPIYFNVDDEWSCCKKRSRQATGCEIFSLRDQDKEELKKGIFRYHSQPYGVTEKGFLTITRGFKCCRRGMSSSGCVTRKMTSEEYKKFGAKEALVFKEHHSSFH